MADALFAAAHLNPVHHPVEVADSLSMRRGRPQPGLQFAFSRLSFFSCRELHLLVPAVGQQVLGGALFPGAGPPLPDIAGVLQDLVGHAQVLGHIAHILHRQGLPRQWLRSGRPSSGKLLDLRSAMICRAVSILSQTGSRQATMIFSTSSSNSTASGSSHRRRIQCPGYRTGPRRARTGAGPVGRAALP